MNKKTITTKKFKDSFKYGGIPVNTINSSDPQTPTEAIEVTLPASDKKALAIAINENLPALLIGEAGTGKTSAIRQLAYLRQQPYVRVNMTGFTTPDELIGSKSVKEGATFFENGIITDAMQRGAILVLDEINATSPDCLFILHGLLDEDRRITLPNGDIVTPHENFRVFATCNPDYEGTKSMNKAFLDRFPIVLTVDVLTPAKEQELLQARTGIDETLANQLVTVATMARKDYTEQKIMSYISTRGLLHIGKLIQAGLEPKTAYETTIVKKTSNKEEQKILTDFFLAVFKMASGEGAENLDVPYITTKRQVKDMEQAIENYNKQFTSIREERTQAIERADQLKRDLDIAVQEANNNGKLATDRQKEIDELKKSVEAYGRLDDIISSVSKGYKPVRTDTKDYKKEELPEVTESD